MLKDELAILVRKTRMTNGWTQEQAAEMCGISDRHLREVEHGNTNVKLDTVEKVCHGIGAVVILKGTGE